MAAPRREGHTSAAPGEVELAGVSKAYRTPGGVTVPALVELSVGFAAGSSVAVTGPSGSGKSTLLHLLGAMDVADSGRVRVGEVEVSGLTRRTAVAYRRTVGFVFQRFHLLPALSALDNVVVPVLPYRSGFDKGARAAELLERVGLGGRADALPAQLSGGQQQRVAIARALMNRPVILLADEPTGNLDTDTGAEIMDLIEGIRRDEGTTVVVATHDQALAARAGQVVRLVDGRLLDPAGAPRLVGPF